MKVLIIATSPRKSFSTSLYFSKLLKIALHGVQTTVLPLKSMIDYHAILEALKNVDTLVFATPVYVDTLPSTTLEYLQKLEKHIVKNHLQFNVYAILNCGFYEGHQCALALNTYALWCQRSDVKWCGGIGIGSGVMLGFIRVLPVMGIASMIIELLVRSIVLISRQGLSVHTLFSGYLPIVLVIQIIVWLLFSLGAFLNIYHLKKSILLRKCHPIKYTTVWFCPRFLFVFMASFYWVLRALLIHGLLPWQLFRKDSEYN